LPATKITPIHRKDSSGTTKIFTGYLSNANAVWKEKVGSGNEVKWPVGVPASRNLGVTVEVYETDGAIGYVDRLYTE
jgi:phosphate transport system substrate-binding protein